MLCNVADGACLHGTHFIHLKPYCRPRNLAYTAWSFTHHTFFYLCYKPEDRSMDKISPAFPRWNKIYFMFLALRKTGRKICQCNCTICRSQWPTGLRRRSVAAQLLRSLVRIPPGAWMFVCCECCVLSGRDLCDELITRPEESYRLWCVVVCDLENLKNKEAMTRVVSQRHRKKTDIIIIHDLMICM